jgi:hypothetical protein
VKSILIITGAAPCVLDDLTALDRDVMPHHVLIIPTADFMAIGLDAVDKYPWRIKYMATYHPAEIPEIKARRESIGGNTDYIVISHEWKEGVDLLEPLLPGERSGSSALLGAQAALKLGYRRIVLCGCPMTGTNIKNSNYESFRPGWEEKKKYLDDRVRSMSGWTRELLGAPTEEWLNG